MNLRTSVPALLAGALIGLCALFSIVVFMDVGVSEDAVPVTPKQKRESSLKSSEASFSFVALGDTGSGASYQRAVSRQIKLLHQRENIALALVLGDVIYPYGDFKKTGKRLYTDYYGSLIDDGVRFRVALGNHDVVKGYDPAVLTFYNMPARYYQFSEGNVDFFSLDTNIIKDAKQLTWLDNALSNSKATWKVVYAHHPVVSSGVHGSSRKLKQSLLPLLKKHRVDFYLAGHDHHYERFEMLGKESDSQTIHIVSGGGGAYLRRIPSRQAHSLVRLKKHHFLHFKVSGRCIDLNVIDKHGNIIDQAEYHK